MTSKKNIQPLFKGKFYHIFNRGINYQNVFFREENYYFFLKKYKDYITQYADTYAYCLLPNHFHFLIRIKDEAPGNDKEIFDTEPFRRLFIAYSQAINKDQKRSGSLFCKIFKRIEINDENYLRNLVFYIHNNPVKHNLSNTLYDYRFSSYKAIISDQPTQLSKKDLLYYFNEDIKVFIQFHNFFHDEFLIKKYLLEG